MESSNNQTDAQANTVNQNGIVNQDDPAQHNGNGRVSSRGRRASVDEDPLFDQEVAELFNKDSSGQDDAAGIKRPAPSPQVHQAFQHVQDQTSQMQQISLQLQQLQQLQQQQEQQRQQEQHLSQLLGNPNSQDTNTPVTLADVARLVAGQQQQQNQGQLQQQQAGRPLPLPTRGGAADEDEEDDEVAKPKRSLSAYNLFFQTERKKLLKTLPVKGKKPRKSHGKIGFADMARTIAAKWKKITPDEKSEYDRLAALDKQRYKSQMVVYQQNKSDMYRANSAGSFAYLGQQARSNPSQQQPQATANHQWPGTSNTPSSSVLGGQLQTEFLLGRQQVTQAAAPSSVLRRQASGQSLASNVSLSSNTLQSMAKSSHSANSLSQALARARNNAQGAGTANASFHQTGFGIGGSQSATMPSPLSRSISRNFSSGVNLQALAAQQQQQQAAVNAPAFSRSTSRNFSSTNLQGFSSIGSLQNLSRSANNSNANLGQITGVSGPSNMSNQSWEPVNVFNNSAPPTDNESLSHLLNMLHGQGATGI
uniref:HMG box domain-containing protein n=1 Tax=Entomoneis paludosa TaxID=265537 RepID=A0A7S2VBS3_9STRA